MSFFCADSNERYCRRYNIRVFWDKENNDEDIYERALEVANDIGVTKCEQDVSVCHRLHSRNCNICRT